MLLPLLFFQNTVMAAVGYIWINDAQQGYHEFLPNIGAIVSKEEINVRYVYENTDTINQIVNTLRTQATTECDDNEDQQFSANETGDYDYDRFFNPKIKNCGFPSIALSKGSYYRPILKDIKKLKILSYYYVNGQVFALIEYSLLKNHPLNK
jgi:hypothetical protein